MHYQKLKAGWDKAASKNPNGAIHPAGNESELAYLDSGVDDLDKLIQAMEAEDITTDDRKHLTIIDYGCGNGRLTVPLSDVFKKVYAVDISYGMLQQLPKMDCIIPVLVNENVFIVPGNRAELAVSISVFIHNTYDDGMKILQQLGMNMLEGGLLFLQIPVYDERKEPSDWTDVGVWTEQDLVFAANMAGMEVRKVFTNPGIFSYESVGPNHAAFQVLQKIN
jgi:SAM-dependent methyltransferase